MPPPLVVPDASVLLKWVLRSTDEESVDAAVALRDAWFSGVVDIVVPSLWAYEVGNVLGLKQPALAGEMLQSLLDLRLPEERPQAYSSGIFTLMKESGATFYDAAYHALAIARGGVMLTADRKYVAKCGRAGAVSLIEAWSSSPGAPGL